MKGRTKIACRGGVSCLKHQAEMKATGEVRPREGGRHASSIRGDGLKAYSSCAPSSGESIRRRV